MAAAIITPARLDFDSRWSSVIIALPAPIDISSASSSSPALRQALAGSRRNSARNAGSPSRRSINCAAMSASDVAMSGSAHPFRQRPGEDDDHGDEARHPERDQHRPDDVLGREVLHHRLVAKRHADREEAGEEGPGEAEDRVAHEHRGVRCVVALARQLARELVFRAAAQPRLLEHVDEDLVAVAVDERVEVEEPADVGGEGQVEEDVADGAIGEEEAADGEDRADREVRHRTSGGDRHPAAARLEPRLRGIDEGVREDEQQLQAGLVDLAPEGGHRERVRALVDRHHDEAARQEHEAAEPDLRRDDERRAVAAGDQVGEDADAGDGQRGQRDQRDLGEQHPAPAPVQGLVEGADAVEGLDARPEQPLEEALGSGRVAARGGRARDAGQESALAEVGQEAGEPGRPGWPELLLGEPDQVHERARAVELPEDLRIVVRQAQVGVRVEVLEHPALAALVGLQSLERVAGPNARAHPELGGLARHVRPAHRRHDQAGARAHHDGAARLRVVPAALDAHLLVAQPQADPVAQLDRTVDARAVDPGPVAGARVLDRRRAAPVARDPRVDARDRRVVEHHGRARLPPDDHLGHDRNPRPIPQHQLERGGVPRPRRAAAEAEAAPSIELAPTARAEHRYGPSDSDWKTGLSPLKPTSVWSFGFLVGRRTSEPTDSWQPSSACTTTRPSPSPRHAILHARTLVGFALVSRKSSFLARYSWNGPPPWLEASASLVPSGEKAASSTPSLPLDVSVTSLPEPQSFGSVENAFFERQRKMPNSPSWRTPNAMIVLPSGAQWIERPTENFGSAMQRGVIPSLVTCPRHRSVSVPFLCATASRFTSAVGAHAGSEYSSPSGVSAIAVESGFVRSLSMSRSPAMYATLALSGLKVGSFSRAGLLAIGSSFLPV